MFSEAEQKAIQEKLEQLGKVKEGSLSLKKLSDLITQRRVAWMKEHLEEMLAKYPGLRPEEQAYRIIFFDHMKINPEHSKMTRVSSSKIRIDSYNFCPYLEACKQLDLDTSVICKEVGEPSMNEMARMINQSLKFSRNYLNLRPHNCAFCEEYIEFLEQPPTTL